MKYIEFINEEYHGMIDLRKEFKTEYRIKPVKYKDMTIKMIQYKDGKNMFGSDIWKFIPNYSDPKNYHLEPSKKVDNNPFRYIYSYTDAPLERWIEEHPIIDRYFEENRLHIRREELDARKKHLQ